MDWLILGHVFQVCANDQQRSRCAQQTHSEGREGKMNHSACECIHLCACWPVSSFVKSIPLVWSTMWLSVHNPRAKEMGENASPLPSGVK